ncbi:Uma2 family endonuclease [Chloroflexi bacterium TSY]|nr:Uma2 family endonuclease [Chloroflexi bacterium TSY]
MAALQASTRTPSSKFSQWILSPPSMDALKAEFEKYQNLDLPGSDGEPMENDRERIQINLGLQSIDHHWADRDDFFAGGNMFIYFNMRQATAVMAEIADPSLPRRTFRGPDMFVVFDVDGSYRRQKWVVWEEEGRYPDVIFEYLSPSTRKTDLDEKKNLYERTFTTHEYFCFDYLDPHSEDSLRGWRLDAHQRYQPIEPNEHGWLWSERLGLWVGTWQGTIERDETTWLRFYTENGELVLTATEAETMARQTAEEQAAQEANARQAAEEQATQEANARQVAEEQAVQEANARQAAEERAKTMEDENARLRAELARLRGDVT